MLGVKRHEEKFEGEGEVDEAGADKEVVGVGKRLEEHEAGLMNGAVGVGKRLEEDEVGLMNNNG